MNLNLSYVLEIPFSQDERDFWGGEVEDHVDSLLNVDSGDRNWIRGDEVIKYINDSLKEDELTKGEILCLNAIQLHLENGCHRKGLKPEQVLFLWETEVIRM